MSNDPLPDFLSIIDGAAIEARTTAWAGISSGSDHVPGLDAMRARLAEDFAAVLGIPAEEVLLDPPPARPGEARTALLFRRRPDAPRRVLLGGHFDTVFGPEHPFQSVRRDGELLRGPGVVDMKGGLSVMLEALAAFERSPAASTLGWTVCLNPDEEIGSPWSRPLWKRLAGEHERGLLFEPAMPGGRLVRSRKGSGNFHLAIRGRAAHAGRNPELGRNAVLAAAELAHAFAALNGQRDGIYVNVGRISGGGALNIVPDRAELGVNVRTVREGDEEWFHARAARLLADLNARDGFAAEWIGEFASPPKPATPATDAMLADLIACGRRLGLSLETGDSGGASDGNKLQAYGLPVIDNLGPRGGGLHSEDEHAVIESFAERARLTALYLWTLAGGES